MFHLAARERAVQSPGGAWRLAAPAKLNLDLLVGPVRDGGYHPLDSLVARISLYDEIILLPREEGIGFFCRGADCGPDEDNLAVRAAEAMARFRPDAGVEIELTKRIPPGAGLGGGSSDAAAVLHGLESAWGLGLTPERLSKIAAGLGSDVPLFLGGPASRMTGRGEILDPVAVHDFHAVLFLPEFDCATASVYKAYDVDPRPIRRLLDPSEAASAPPSSWRDRLVNDLAEPACRVEPRLAELRHRLSEAVDLPVHVTGSGSGLFILCDDLTEAEAAFERIPVELRPRCRIVGKNPW